MSPKLTVFTPTFNRAHTLERAMKSLQQQTFMDFEWLIIDDGSTDNTKELIEKFKDESDLNIRYYKQENQHKFLTFFDGVNLAKGEYFCPLDSDDALKKDALESILNVWDHIKDDNIVFVCSLCEDQFGNLIGNQYPSDPLVCSIFDMRYIYKVKGDKWGIGKTEVYKKMTIDKAVLKNRGFIPEGVFQFQFDQLGLHYFVNKVTRIYYRDLDDSASLANSYYDAKNAFGLAENYKAFLNQYHNKIWSSPKTIIRNIGGYLKYSKIDNRSLSKTIKEIDSSIIRFISIFFFPISKYL